MLNLSGISRVDLLTALRRYSPTADDTIDLADVATLLRSDLGGGLGMSEKAVAKIITMLACELSEITHESVVNLLIPATRVPVVEELVAAEQQRFEALDQEAALHEETCGTIAPAQANAAIEMFCGTLPTKERSLVANAIRAAPGGRVDLADAFRLIRSQQTKASASTLLKVIDAFCVDGSGRLPVERLLAINEMYNGSGTPDAEAFARHITSAPAMATERGVEMVDYAALVSSFVTYA